MKASELRLGNWVNTPYGNGAVMSLRDQSYYPGYLRRIVVKTKGRFSEDTDVLAWDPDEVNPIPITEEVLVKCGFEHNEATLDYDLYRGSNYLAVFRRMDEWKISCQCENVNIQMKIEYLHELQNIHFIATGEELEVKL